MISKFSHWSLTFLFQSKNLLFMNSLLSTSELYFIQYQNRINVIFLLYLIDLYFSILKITCFC